MRIWLRRTETGQPFLVAYVLALALVGAVIALKHLAGTPLGNDAPFLFLLGTTMLVTWHGGRWAGMVAAVVGTLAVNYFFLPPYDDWHSTPAANAETVLFGIENLLVAWLTSLLVAARTRAQTTAERMRRMYAVSSATSNARTLDAIGRIVARESAEAIGATAAAVFIADETRQVLRTIAQTRADAAAAPTVLEGERDVPIDGPLPVAVVFRTGEPVSASDAGELRARFPELWSSLRSPPPRASLFCVPVPLAGATLGVAAFAFDRDRELSPDERLLAVSLARDCGQAIGRVRLFDSEHEARLAAEQANHAKDEFLSIVSHELRTPLTAMAGWVYLLKRTSDRHRIEHGLEVIERSLKAQTHIVEDILDVQRIVARKLRIERKPLDFVAVVRAVVAELSPLATARGLELTLSSPGEVRVLGDATRLRQATENLVCNAIKFTPRGGHVRVDVEVGQGRTRLRVRDDGKGIAAEDLTSVFELFHQVDSSATRSEGGLGLGLTITRDLIAAHGGVVRLESAGLGLGTTAVVELPPMEVQAALPPANDGAAVPTLTSLRVLVVDDDAASLESVSSILADAGAEVHMARSAVAALAELSGFTPDVLVSDISMPEHDGYWLIRKVRSMGTLSARVPAIALTAYGSAEGAKVAARKAGYQRHLTKPAEPAVLASTIVELAKQAA